MKHTFFYLSLLLGSLICLGTLPAQAKDDKKLSAAEKRELKKKEREAKKEARKKSKGDKGDEKDEAKKDDKPDKKAVSNAVKKLKPVCGRIKGNGKFYMYIQYTTMTEAGEEMLTKISEAERGLKSAKVCAFLISDDASIEDDEAEKTLKKMKVKLPMVRKFGKMEEQLPGYKDATPPRITIVDPTGKVVADGGESLLETWPDAIGAKKPAKPAEEEEETDDE